MPLAVWVDLVGPHPEERDEQERAQLPGLIGDLVQAGWEVTGFAEVSGIDEDPQSDAHGELLDFRVLGYPGGAYVGLVVDSELDEALAVGAGLARHLISSAPVLLGWSVESLRSYRLASPGPAGTWLPDPADACPRFPVAEHLSNDLQKLAAQYLIAGAVQNLADPTGSTRKVDASDLVAGVLAESPWDREVAGALGGLLIAAGRGEAETDERGRLVAHGEGDRELALALLEAVRAEIDDEEDDAYDDLFHVLEQLIPPSRVEAPGDRGIWAVLGVIAAAARSIGRERAAEIAGYLFGRPADHAAMVLRDVSAEEENVRLQRQFLAEAAETDPVMAGEVGASMVHLLGDDPRDEPALRSSCAAWWNTAMAATRPLQVRLQDIECPEPGASFLRAATDDTQSPVEDQSLELTSLAHGVAQAVSALARAIDDPELCYTVFAPS